MRTSCPNRAVASPRATASAASASATSVSIASPPPVSPPPPPVSPPSRLANEAAAGASLAVRKPQRSAAPTYNSIQQYSTGVHPTHHYSLPLHWLWRREPALQ